MKEINVRCSFSTETKDPLLWTITGIDTPVRYCTVHFLPVEQNILQVKVHEDAIKTMRLKKLRKWKKEKKLSKICGYGRKNVEFINVFLPPSWKGVQIRPMLYWFLRILLDEAWKEF